MDRPALANGVPGDLYDRVVIPLNMTHPDPTGQ